MAGKKVNVFSLERI